MTLFGSFHDENLTILDSPDFADLASNCVIDDSSQNFVIIERVLCLDICPDLTEYIINLFLWPQSEGRVLEMLKYDH